MNNKRPKNIDGFVLRRRAAPEAKPGNRLGIENLSLPDRFKQGQSEHSSGLAIETRRTQQEAPMLKAAVAPSISKSEIDASLADIDNATPPPKKRRFRPSKKVVKRIILVILLLALLGGGYMGYKLFASTGQVFKGNLFDLLGNGKALQADQYGRTNILVFGTSEDDPSHEDAAPNLADSILLVSIDQKTKQAAMFSVPRDLYVSYGKACNAGYSGKINEVYECNSNNDTDETAGSNAMMAIVGQTFGLDIQYFVHVNYTVLRESVNAVGGITVNIQSDDPRGILDRNFDWMCNYKCYYVKWPNGPAQLDGDHALALARARGAAGYNTYGLGRANFDREQNQQKIILALKDKATTAGVLANPVAINGLLDSLGKNVRTNFDTGEVKTLINLAKDINDSSIKRIDLIADGESVLTTGSIAGAGSIVRPIAGLTDFSDVQSYIRRQLTQTPGDTENANIQVLNGSDTSGVAGSKAKELAQKGINVSSTGDAPTSSSYGALQWFDLTGGKKPLTNKKLETALGTPNSGATLPSGVQSSADFVIIVGNGAN